MAMEELLGFVVFIMKLVYPLKICCALKRSSENSKFHNRLRKTNALNVARYFMSQLRISAFFKKSSIRVQPQLNAKNAKLFSESKFNSPAESQEDLFFLLFL